MDWDALLLSRLQFAFTVSFHIIFPSITIGLASYLAVLEGLWLKTGNEVFRNLYLCWMKIFALAFGMGVVSGVVMSYQFGTNWSVFSDMTGSVLGPLRGYEVLTAFFLEASFLGIMLFGWNKVGPRLHFLATCFVAFGTLFSAFWILSANSWMQTPAGYEVRDGLFYAVDWLEVIFNPSFPTRFLHMIAAAYLTTGFAVLGAAGWLWLKGKDDPETQVMRRMAIGMIVLLAPLQLLIGHESGVVAHEHQPAKVAAMEGWWETRSGQPSILFALPDQEGERNRMEIAIPKIGSWVVAGDIDAEIQGLDAFAPGDRPPVAITFWAFRIMVGLGMAMIGLGLWGTWLWWRGRLEKARLSGQADQTGIVRFEVIDPPQVGLQPVSPNRPMLSLLVLLGGLAAGAGLAYLMSMQKPVFLNTRTLTQTTGLPVLGSVSAAWTAERAVARRKDRMAYAGAMAGLLVVFVAFVAVQGAARVFLSDIVG
jgi:cytochrome d ubiquinol oxidase subunit I